MAFSFSFSFFINFTISRWLLVMQEESWCEIVVVFFSFFFSATMCLLCKKTYTKMLALFKSSAAEDLLGSERQLCQYQTDTVFTLSLF